MATTDFQTRDKISSAPPNASSQDWHLSIHSRQSKFAGKSNNAYLAESRIARCCPGVERLLIAKWCFQRTQYALQARIMLQHV